MTSQQTPTPGFFERIFDFKDQWKLFLMLHKDPEVNPLMKLAYWVCVLVLVPAYICAPDMIPGPIDDLFVSWWLIPYVLSHVFVFLSPDWLVKYYRQEIEKEKDLKVEGIKFSKAKKDHVDSENSTMGSSDDVVDATWDYHEGA